MEEERKASYTYMRRNQYWITTTTRSIGGQAMEVVMVE